jgi:zinc D-Ala-D-Ala carboxypeptidase
MEKITKNFSLKELIKSDKAVKLNINNEPSEEVIGNLIALCENTLQPIRDLVGYPITITSGFRCPALNKAVGGVSNSQHVIGQAADFKIPVLWRIFGRLEKVFKQIQDSTIPYDQLILEPTWIHVSYSKTNRRQNLVASFVNGKA